MFCLLNFPPGSALLQRLQRAIAHFTIFNHDSLIFHILSGYVSDGDLLGGNTSHHQHDSNRLNDGYLSESGVSIYGRRVNGGSSSANGRRETPNRGSTSQQNGSGKHGIITEDR